MAVFLLFPNPRRRSTTPATPRQQPSPRRRLATAVATAVAAVAATLLCTPPPVAGAPTPAGATSTFNFTVNAPSRGFEAAIEAAEALLSRSWKSVVPVQVRITFKHLTDTEKQTLAHTVNGRSKEVNDTPFPLAAAAALTGTPVCEDDEPRGSPECPYDVDMVVNLRQQWYAPDPAAAGRPPPQNRDQYDLVSVLLHETYHAMLMSGKLVFDVRESSTIRAAAGAAAADGVELGVVGATADAGSGDGRADVDRQIVLGPGPAGISSSVELLPPGSPRDGWVGRRAFFSSSQPGRFDAFLADSKGCSIRSYLTDTALMNKTGLSGKQLLGASITHQGLYFAAADANGRPTTPIARLNAQRTFSRRASVYHLDEATYGHALMTPEMPRGRSVRRPSDTLARIQALMLDESVPGAPVCGAMADPRAPAAVPPELSAASNGGLDDGYGSATSAEDEEPTLLGLPLPVGIGLLVGIAAVVVVGSAFAARGGGVAVQKSRRRSRRRSRRIARASRGTSAGASGGGAPGRGGVDGGRVAKRPRSERPRSEGRGRGEDAAARERRQKRQRQRSSRPPPGRPRSARHGSVPPAPHRGRSGRT